MKRKALSLLVVLFIFATARLHALDLSLKLSGGLGLLSPEIINSMLGDWVEWQKREAAERNSWEYLEEKTGKLKYSTEFEAEILYFPHPRWACGFGSGFIYGELQEQGLELTVQKPTGTFLLVRPQKITAIPLILSGYYFQPLYKQMRLFARIGGGIVYVNYYDRDGNKKTEDDRFVYPFTQEASASGPIFSTSLGLAFETESGLEFFLEGTYRRSTIEGFSGSDKDEISGNLYAYEEYDPDLGFWQRKVGIFPETPGDENYRNIRDARIDLSGMVFRIGISIRF